MKVAEEVGIHVVDKMTDVKTAAMWVEANVLYLSAYITLKHLNTKFNFCVQVPFSQIALLSYYSPSLHSTFSKINFNKKGKETKNLGKM